MRILLRIGKLSAVRLVLALLTVASSAGAEPDEGLAHLLEFLYGQENQATHPGLRLAREGDGLLREGRFPEAASRYGEAAAAKPDAPMLHLRHGYALLRAGRHRDALAALDRCLALGSHEDPWAPPALTYRGFALGQLDRVDEALVAFDASIAARPSAQAHAGRGAAYGRKGRLDLAARDYRAASRLEPDREELAGVADYLEELQASSTFVAGKAREPRAEQSPSGLVYLSLEEGSGPRPGKGDTVRVHYHGTLRDGSVFDSSVDRGAPASFPLDRVIPCWTEGLQKMRVGGRSRLVCPAQIAYGERGTSRIPAGSALVYEMDLLGIE